MGTRSVGIGRRVPADDGDLHAADGGLYAGGRQLLHESALDHAAPVGVGGQFVVGVRLHAGQFVRQRRDLLRFGRTGDVRYGDGCQPMLEQHRVQAGVPAVYILSDYLFHPITPMPPAQPPRPIRCDISVRRSRPLWYLSTAAWCSLAAPLQCDKM